MYHTFVVQILYTQLQLFHFTILCFNILWTIVKFSISYMISTTISQISDFILENTAQSLLDWASINTMSYFCEECGELFSTAWTLERHVKRTHKFSFSVIFVNLKQKISKLLLIMRSNILKNIFSVINATKL